MASNNGSFGKWEVVKKGKKSNGSGGGKNPTDKKSGSGGRKALGESNQPSRRKRTRPDRPGAPGPLRPATEVQI